MKKLSFLLFGLVLTLISCQILTVEEEMTRVSLGLKHECIIEDTDLVVCNGDNSKNQLNAPEDFFIQISSGDNHTCGITVENQVKCWGDNSFKQLQAPTDKNYVLVKSGSMHSCALTFEGKAVCWGLNLVGQSNPPINRYFSTLSLGEQHSCGLNENGEVLCWGDNYYGQSEPQVTRFTALTAGGNGNCGISEGSGKVLCWGENRKYESSPPGGSCRGAKCVWPENISRKIYRKVSKGKYITCAINEDNKIECWGRNQKDHYTNPARILCYPFAKYVVVPVDCYDRVYDDSIEYQSLIVSKFQICARQVSGKLDCWREIPKE